MHEHHHDYSDLYRETVPSVVSVYLGGDGSARTGAGSGFVYDAAHVVTNHHVVAAGGDVAETVDVRFSDGAWTTGRVVGTDASTDLAVVRVDDLPASARPLPVAAANPTPGEPVAALGNPMGLDGTITTGVVSGTNRSMPTRSGFAIPDTVQTDAPINPGNSGGPLVRPVAPDEDATGPDAPPVEVVGVNRARQGDNIGFAVSAAILNRVLPDLVAEGETRHATLHVSTLDVSPTVAEANGLAEPGGVLVVDVKPGPASGVLGESVGTRTVRGREVPVGGDVIVGIDGRDLHSHEALTRYLMTECRPGDVVELSVLRNSGVTTERVTLADREGPAGGRDRRPIDVN